MIDRLRKTRWWHWRRRLVRWVALSFLVLVFVAVTAPEWPDWRDEQFIIRQVVGHDAFDLLSWESQAIVAKAEAMLVRGERQLDEAAQREIVLSFVRLGGEVHRLEASLERLYAVGEGDSVALTSSEQVEADIITTTIQLSQKRAEMAQLQPIAEAVLERQVASVLVDEGFGVADMLWPPMKMRVTPLPTILIISPRDHIERTFAMPLVVGLNAGEKETIERELLEAVDLSAYISPIGGLGTYPAMVIELDDLAFLTDTFAHEWTHHWLGLHPLGLGYTSGAEMPTINETTASIVGREIGLRVMARYYADYLPQAVVVESAAAVAEADADDVPPLPPFDFRAEMRITREEADRLLAEGDIEGAEAYMEARRLIFVENGYLLRKLNQAYFAFHGAYADTPGAGGTDPVGPTVITLFEQSDTLHDFLSHISAVTSFAELQQMVD